MMCRRTYRALVNNSIHVQAFTDSDAVAALSRVYNGIKRDVVEVLGTNGVWFTLDAASANEWLFPPENAQQELPFGGKPYERRMKTAFGFLRG